MDLDLSRKVIAVTGGSRGPGLAIAEGLAREGATLAISARSPADLGTAHAMIEAAGGRCLAYACDLAEPGEAEGFIAAVAETFGRIDGLVCAAGTARPSGFEASHRDDWTAAFSLNLFHAAEALHAALAALASAQGAALFIPPALPHDLATASWHHRAANAALAEAARSLAQEIGPNGIRINALAVTTEASPRDIAAAAAFLVSAQARGITGTLVPVDAPPSDRHGRT